MLNFRSVAALNRALVRGLPRLQGFDSVVGIPRSGTLAATLLALHSQRLSLLGWRQSYKSRRTLLLDDSTRSGKTLRWASSLYPGAQALAVFGVHEHNSIEVCPEPRVFEWNLWRSCHLRKVIVDLDGVLCEDSPMADDPGFIRAARPLFLPRRQVKAVVTCRLEKSRWLTETWLGLHGVSYEELRMMDFPSVAARRKANIHAAWKAEAYKELGASLFVESSSKQAKLISKVGPVWCIENQTLYGG